MLTIVAIIVGALLGATFGEGSGVVIGAVVGWLLVRSWQQGGQIAALRQALKELQAEPGRVARPPAPTAVAGPGEAVEPVDTAADAAADEARAARRREAAAAARAASASVAAAPSMTPAAPMAAVTAAAPAPVPAEALPEAPARDLLAPLRAWLFGGNTIVKAGVGILFIGLAFLAKYAGEHVTVPVELRLAGIGAVAVVLLALGWRLRSSRPGYAQVLQGGAVAVLYLTLFVAFRFYGVLAVGPAFGLMVAVAGLAAALAVLQDARPLAVVGALGGFATPLLVSSGSGNHVALFSYYLVLDLGIAAVAWHRTWRALNLIGFAFTFVVATAWGVLKYQAEHYASGQFFLIAFFLLFQAILLLPARRRAAAGAAVRADGWVNGCLLFGLPTIGFVLQHGLVRDMAYGSALSALVLAAWYVGLASFMRRRPQFGVTFFATLAIATVFLTLVIPFALDARSTAGAWALEGAGLVWLGFRQSRGLARAFGYALLLLSGGAMLYAHERYGAPTQVFNTYLFNALMAAAAALVAALCVQRFAAPAPDTAVPTPAKAPNPGLLDSEPLLQPLLIGWATLWLVGAAGMQIDSFVPARYALAAWLAGLSAVAVLYATLSVRLAWPQLTWMVMAHAPVLGLAVAGSAALLAVPLDDGGWWAWPLALATHLGVLRYAAPRWPAWAVRAVHALGALVLAGLGALQGRALTAGWGDTASAWAWLGWLLVPALLLVLLLRPASAARWPLRAEPPAYQTWAAAVLTAGLLLWTVLANFASDGSALPLPHLPLLNPLDLGVAAALLAAWSWLRSAGAQALLAGRPLLTPVLLGAAGFLWLNAMLVRAFHHYGGVPLHIDAWAQSLAVQTGITLLWTTTALVLMWLSARRAQRLPWTVGAALLAAVVAKLLLVDLSGSGTVTRIVSFIGVGVLMLVIGYVAPLPAKKDSHVAG